MPSKGRKSKKAVLWKNRIERWKTNPPQQEDGSDIGTTERTPTTDTPSTGAVVVDIVDVTEDVTVVGKETNTGPTEHPPTTHTPTTDAAVVDIVNVTEDVTVDGKETEEDIDMVDVYADCNSGVEESDSEESEASDIDESDYSDSWDDCDESDESEVDMVGSEISDNAAKKSDVYMKLRGV